MKTPEQIIKEMEQLAAMNEMLIVSSNEIGVVLTELEEAKNHDAQVTALNTVMYSDLKALKARIIELEDERNGVCEWTYVDDGYGDRWETQCGEAFIFEVETPKGHGYNYCPKCGKLMQEVAKPEADDEWSDGYPRGTR